MPTRGVDKLVDFRRFLEFTHKVKSWSVAVLGTELAAHLETVVHTECAPNKISRCLSYASSSLIWGCSANSSLACSAWTLSS